MIKAGLAELVVEQLCFLQRDLLQVSSRTRSGCMEIFVTLLWLARLISLRSEWLGQSSVTGAMCNLLTAH